MQEKDAEKEASALAAELKEQGLLKAFGGGNQVNASHHSLMRKLPASEQVWLSDQGLMQDLIYLAAPT